MEERKKVCKKVESCASNLCGNVAADICTSCFGGSNVCVRKSESEHMGSEVLCNTIIVGHSCKIGNMRCPGTLKNQNPQFEEKK